MSGPVTDPDLLAQLNAAPPDAPRPVTDPALLEQLNGTSAVGGLAKAAGTGLAKAGIGLATMMPQQIYDPMIVGAQSAAKLTGYELPGVLEKWPGSAKAVQNVIEAYTGPLYKPENTPERYTETIASMAPGLVTGRGAIIRKLLQNVVAPGVGSEYLGEKAAEYGPKAETAGRIIGALLGVGAGAGGSAAVSGVKNRLATGQAAREVSDIVGAPVGAGATRRVGASVEADRLTPADVAGRTGELGNDAMVLDMGRQLRGRAEAVATQPGRGQNTVLDAVEGRTGRFGEGTAQRVQQTLDQEMGPTHNVVDLVDRVNSTVDRAAGPLYRQVMAAHPVVDVPPEITARPVIRQAMANAKELAANYGEQITVDAKPSLRAWDYVKKDLDRRINAYQRSGGASELNSADKADMGGLMDARKALVDHLDTVTQGEYKQARQVAATKYELREALDYGRDAFNTRLLPEEFANELSQMSIPQRTMAQVGFRRELDRITEATRNEGATARRVLDTNHVLQKTEMLFGPQAAREIERRIGAENTFQEATTDIARNSRTAVRQELQKDTSTPSSSDVRGTSLMGLGWAAGRGGLNYIRENGMENTRNQIADILTTGGDKVGPTIEALNRLQATRARNVRQIGDPRAAALIDALMAGQR